MARKRSNVGRARGLGILSHGRIIISQCLKAIVWYARLKVSRWCDDDEPRAASTVLSERYKGIDSQHLLKLSYPLLYLPQEEHLIFFTSINSRISIMLFGYTFLALCLAAHSLAAPRSAAPATLKGFGKRATCPADFKMYAKLINTPSFPTGVVTI